MWSALPSSLEHVKSCGSGIVALQNLGRIDAGSHPRKETGGRGLAAALAAQSLVAG